MSWHLHLGPGWLIKVDSYGPQQDKPTGRMTPWLKEEDIGTREHPLPYNTCPSPAHAGASLLCGVAVGGFNLWPVAEHRQNRNPSQATGSDRSTCNPYELLYTHPKKKDAQCVALKRQPQHANQDPETSLLAQSIIPDMSDRNTPPPPPSPPPLPFQTYVGFHVVWEGVYLNIPWNPGLPPQPPHRTPSPQGLLQAGWRMKSG